MHHNTINFVQVKFPFLLDASTNYFGVLCKDPFLLAAFTYRFSS